MSETPPAHIVALARDILALETGIHKPTNSPSLSREVIADWCEECGLGGYARYLRPRPAGRDEKMWLRLRATILRWLVGDVAETEEPLRVLEAFEDARAKRFCIHHGRWHCPLDHAPPSNGTGEGR